MNKIETQQPCSICFHEFEKDQTGSLLNASSHPVEGSSLKVHTFHQECMEKYRDALEAKRETTVTDPILPCPLCRGPILILKSGETSSDALKAAVIQEVWDLVDEHVQKASIEARDFAVNHLSHLGNWQRVSQVLLNSSVSGQALAIAALDAIHQGNRPQFSDLMEKYAEFPIPYRGLIAVYAKANGMQDSVIERLLTDTPYQKNQIQSLGAFLQHTPDIFDQLEKGKHLSSGVREDAITDLLLDANWKLVCHLLNSGPVSEKTLQTVAVDAAQDNVWDLAMQILRHNPTPELTTKLAALAAKQKKWEGVEHLFRTPDPLPPSDCGTIARLAMESNQWNLAHWIINTRPIAEEAQSCIFKTAGEKGRWNLVQEFLLQWDLPEETRLYLIQLAEQQSRPDIVNLLCLEGTTFEDLTIAIEKGDWDYVNAALGLFDLPEKQNGTLLLLASALNRPDTINLLLQKSISEVDRQFARRIQDGHTLEESKRAASIRLVTAVIDNSVEKAQELLLQNEIAPQELLISLRLATTLCYTELCLTLIEHLEI